MPANPIPDGFGTLTPHIVVQNAAEAIEHYKEAFGAEEVCRLPSPDGKIMHAELKIGSSMMMLCDEFDMPGAPKTPQALNGTPCTLHLYCEKVDESFQRAVDAGCTPVLPPADAFWGDRFGKVVDKFGHHWSIATHLEDLTPEQIGQKAQEFFQNCPPPQ